MALLDVGAQQEVAVPHRLEVVRVGLWADGVQGADEAPVEPVDLPLVRGGGAVVPEDVASWKHPGVAGRSVIPPDRHPAVVEDHRVALVQGGLEVVHREEPRRHRRIAGEGVVGEVVRQAAHVVAILEPGVACLSCGDGKRSSGAELDHLAEVAGAEGMVAERLLPASGGVALHGHRRVVTAHDVVVDVDAEAREEARGAEAHRPVRWRRSGNAGTEEPRDRNRREGNRQGVDQGTGGGTPEMPGPHRPARSGFTATTISSMQARVNRRVDILSQGVSGSGAAQASHRANRRRARPSK